MKIKESKVYDFYIPSKLIFKNKLYEMTKVDKKFIIRGYIVRTIDNQISSIILNNPHPNAHPRTGEFCISNSLRSLKFNKKTKGMIGLMLCHFNLDNCYFTPWNEIEYKRIE
jgi:hypothetical protein